MSRETMRASPVGETRAVHLRGRFRIARTRFADSEIRRALDRATAHEHATLPYTVRSVRLIAAMRRHVDPRVAVVTRAYPEHDTVVYWLESRVGGPR